MGNHRAVVGFWERRWIARAESGVSVRAARASEDIGGGESGFFHFVYFLAFHLFHYKHL